MVFPSVCPYDAGAGITGRPAILLPLKIGRPGTASTGNLLSIRDFLIIDDGLAIAEAVWNPCRS